MPFAGKKQDELVALLEQEEDFSATMSLLEEVVVARGGKLCWLPKFTPEFQPMECCYRCQNKTFNSNDYLASLFCFRDYTNFCKERNIVGNSKGFLQRVLSADCVVTPEKCQKYFLSCERYHKLLSNDVK